MVVSVQSGLSGVVALSLPLVALLAGFAVYRDANSRGTDRNVAALLGFVIGGLFLAGSLPGLVALAVAEDRVVQGFPTSIRILPGVAALLVYLYFRSR